MVNLNQSTFKGRKQLLDINGWAEEFDDDKEKADRGSYENISFNADNHSELYGQTILDRNKYAGQELGNVNIKLSGNSKWTNIGWNSIKNLSQISSKRVNFRKYIPCLYHNLYHRMCPSVMRTGSYHN